MELKNLSNGLAITLPDDLLWTDEHAWSPPISSVSYLINGALLVQSAIRQAGRPITLVGAIDMAWVTRATISTLHTWSAIALDSNAGRFELRLADARVFTVGFRHTDTAIEAEPVLGFPARRESDYYRITLRLMEL